MINFRRKMTASKQASKQASNKLSQLKITLAIAFISLLVSNPVYSAPPTSFPQYPLQIKIEPSDNMAAANIVFILSAGEYKIVSENTDVTYVAGFPAFPIRKLKTTEPNYDNPYYRSYFHNLIYYNPAVTYHPWLRNLSTGERHPRYRLNRQDLNNLTQVPIGDSLLNTVFYVPKSGISNPELDKDNYNKFWIGNGILGDHPTESQARSRRGSNKYDVIRNLTRVSYDGDKVHVQRCLLSPSLVRANNKTPGGSQPLDYRLPFPNGKVSAHRESIPVPLGLYRSPMINPDSSDCNVQSLDSLYVHYTEPYAYRNGQIRIWNNETPADPGRSNKEELENFYTWRDYYSTRIRIANAGLLETLYRLDDKKFRVGYRGDDLTRFDYDYSTNTHNRSGIRGVPGESNTGNNRFISHQISDRIQFNTGKYISYKEKEYSGPKSEDMGVNTSVSKALIDVGEYFKDNDPYIESIEDNFRNSRPKVTKELYCRKNYAVIITDGTNLHPTFDSNTSNPLWPSGEGKEIVKIVKVNSKDREIISFPNLASIANYYWKTDLRPDAPNNVPSTAGDKATWQHMNTVIVAIGPGVESGTPATPPTGGPWPLVSACKDHANYDPDYVPPSNIRLPNIQPKDRVTKEMAAACSREKMADLARAAGEGRGAFIVTHSADDMADKLVEYFTEELNPTSSSMSIGKASASNAASSSNRLEADTLNFSASFDSGSWLGEITAAKFNLSSGGFDQPVWKLSETFAPGKVNAHFSSRPILTSHSGAAQLFDKTSITNALFGRNSGNDAVTAANNIDYLRGVQILEQSQSGTLRNRQYPFGDIINASPFYVLDSETLFVGANDGMLHGLDAKNGKVLFSYVPKGIDINAMASLSSVDYEHRFLFDGNIDVSNSNVSKGKNILLAALGRGGRGVFALDVTDPKTMTAANVLWDHSTQDRATNANMGYVLGRLRIRPGNGNKTYAFVPNGIESVSGKAVLFAYELDADGHIIKTHELIADNGSGNGLMSLGFADTDGNGTIDIVYGGDLKGNLWRWDFSAENPADATLLFTALNDQGQRQAITGGITNARNAETGEIFVGFGTGRLISDNDLPTKKNTTPQVIQSIYGLIDSDMTISSRAELQRRSITYTGKLNDDKVRAFESYSALTSGKKGWYIDLPQNERVISDPSMMGHAAMTISSINPLSSEEGDADCASASGSGFINAINLFSGTGPALTSEGYFRSYPRITLPSGVEVTVGSVGIDGGLPTSTNILCDEEKCKVVAESGKGELVERDGITLEPLADTPRRIQWRKLR